MSFLRTIPPAGCARRSCGSGFEIVQAEPVPVHKVPQITDVPLIWRYFLAPLQSVVARLQIDEKEYVARTVMHLNTALQGVYVFSSGKNMGTFKAVGYPEDVGRFYRLEQLCGLLLDGTRALSDKHARLVGRRAPVYAARLFGRTQRGDLVL